MATVISIKVGAAAAVGRSFADDTKATMILQAFYAAVLAPDPPVEITERDKLLAIIDWLVAQLRDQAMDQHIRTERQRVEQDAQTLFTLN